MRCIVISLLNADMVFIWSFHWISCMKLTSSQKQNSVNISIQCRLFVHCYLDIVDTSFEHEGAHTYWVHLFGHQRVPSGEGEDIVWEISRRVDVLGPVQICYTLKIQTEKKTKNTEHNNR